jgi:hypothetical protein
MQVCTCWHNIILLHPSLWVYIEFNAKSGVNKVKNCEDRLCHYVGMGDPNKQSLFIPNWHSKLSQDLLPVLKSCAVSPAALEIDLMEDPEGSWNVQAIQAEEVTIYHSAMLRTCHYITALLCLAHKVTMHGNPPAWGELPWVKLRTLVINEFSNGHHHNNPGISFTREDLSQLLKVAPFLESLQLAFKVDETPLMWDRDISIEHSRLASLTVHLHHFVGRKGLFGIQLNAPALRTIEFISIDCRSASVEGEIFICKLNTPTKLVLPELGSHKVDLATALLRWLPNIQYLNVIGRNTNTFLNIA